MAKLAPLNFSAILICISIDFPFSLNSDKSSFLLQMKYSNNLVGKIVKIQADISSSPIIHADLSARVV